MSKLAYHAAHFKSGSVNAIGGHNFEKRGEFDRHSNQDIDMTRSHLNVQLVRPEQSLYQTIKSDLAERCTGRVTAASNWMTETIVYPPDNILTDREKCIEYFKDVVGWHIQEFGEENVKSSVAHFDETTPHLHTDLIPLTEDGRLSSKEVFARKNLNRHHTELAAYLQERGWDIQRGEPALDRQRKSLTIKEFKREAEATRTELLQDIKRLDQERSSLIQEYNDLVNTYNDLIGDHQTLSEDVQKLRDVKDNIFSIDAVETRLRGFGTNKRVELSQEDWGKVQNVAKKNFALEIENIKLSNGNSKLSQENHRINTRLNELVDDKMQLQRENTQLRAEISPLKEFIQTFNLVDPFRDFFLDRQRQQKQQRRSQSREDYDHER